MRFIGLIAILLLVFTIGCGPTIMEGKRIDASQRGEIIKGQTTTAGVVEILGQPAKIEKLPSGAEKYVYQYYKEEYSAWWTLPKYERQKMEVFIKNGIVQDYVYNVERRGMVTEEDVR
ncbi:MAG: hypothetical protein OEW45_20725 [Deltaproteobacteria bacterium]|jgi:hypothetical protein|nr:hypothetical protein [Deltaproteobacteria bacterium]